MPIAGLSEYQRSLLAARTRALRRTASSTETMVELLGEAQTDIMVILDILPKADYPLRRALLTGKLRQIEDRLAELGDEYNGLVSGAVSDTIDDVVTVRRSATARLGDENRRAIDASFTRVPQAALRLYAQRLDTEGLKLSGRLWAQSQMNTIQRLIGGALARGERAGRLAAKLEAFLEPAERGGAKRAVHLGDSPVSHKATRVAITEINTAYHEASALSADDSPLVEAQLWQLSGRHPRTDECDMLSWSNGYDLGAGVYPTGSLPAKPHPHCLCYTVDVLREVADWGRPKRSYGAPRLDRIDRRALADAPAAVRARIGGKMFTPAQLRAAVEGMPREDRGHLTPRYVDRMIGQWESGVVGGSVTEYGAAIGGAA